MYNPWTVIKGGIAGGKRATRHRRAKGENYNCKSVINKMYFKKRA